MPTANQTIERIVEASDLNQRVAQIRLVPQNHGTGEHMRIFAEVARVLYLPYLAPDFAYIHEAPFYEQRYFIEVYNAAHQATDGFKAVSEDDLTKTLQTDPRTLLVFRTILGLTREEFAHSKLSQASRLGCHHLRRQRSIRWRGMELQPMKSTRELRLELSASSWMDLCLANLPQDW